MSLQNDLKSLGFDDKKAAIYLTLLELGMAKANEISKKAGVERPTTYDLLGKLSIEGLISSHEKRGIRYYAAENPEKIRNRIMEMEKRQIVSCLSCDRSMVHRLQNRASAIMKGQGE